MVYSLDFWFRGLALLLTLGSVLYLYPRRKQNSTINYYFLFFLLISFYNFFLFIPMFFYPVNWVWGVSFIIAYFFLVLCAFSAFQVALRLTLQNKKIIFTINLLFLLYGLFIILLYIFLFEIPVINSGFILWQQNYFIGILARVPLLISALGFAVKFFSSISKLNSTRLKIRSFILAFSALLMALPIYFYFPVKSPFYAQSAYYSFGLAVLTFLIGNLMGTRGDKN